jgi:cell fate (sporulation/competence/biofilm development) regulator YlbF (YheA/YmcA/DUF963 family)
MPTSDFMVKAQVQMWCTVARVALQADDAPKVGMAADQLEQLAIDEAISSNERYQILHFCGQVGTALMESGLKELEKVVAQLSTTIPELENAIDIAKSAALLVPDAADAAKTALSSYENVQQVFDAWQQATTDRETLLAQLGEFIDKLEDLSTSLNA